MKTLKEGQIRFGIFELASLVDVPVEDLKQEYEKTVESLSGKNAIFLGDDREQVQTMALEKMYKAYKKTLQYRKFLTKETSEETKETQIVKEDE